MLTIHLLTQNNAGTLDRCLNSIYESFPSGFYRIVVGDCGSTDGTREQCIRHDIDVVPVDASSDVSDARNRVIDREGWNLFLEPWEVLVSGQDHIFHTVKDGGSHLRFNIIHGDSIQREVRLWRAADFSGRVFERVNLDGGNVVGVIAADEPTTRLRDKKIVDHWCETSPSNPDAFYFRASLALGNRKFDDFLRDATYYRFLTKGNQPNKHTVLLWYYEGCVECYRSKRPEVALQRCIACLAVKPTMAEFWCLLGDIHYHLLHDFKKAADFYENAIVLGSRRLSDDDWPMEISKYRDYPMKMAESCRSILSANRDLNSVNLNV